MAAYLAAVAATLYGGFARARQELAGVSWENLPPLYQGFRQHARSVVALLQDRDYLKALQLAREALTLCQVPAAFPGSARSRVALETTIAACQLLAGYGSPETRVALDQATKSLPGVGPVLPAWALASYYEEEGQPEAAAQYARLVQRLAPHCRPVNTFA